MDTSTRVPRRAGSVAYRAVHTDRKGYLPTIDGEVAQLVAYPTPEAATEAASLLVERSKRTIWPNRP